MLKKSVEQRTRDVLEQATKQTEAEKAQTLLNANFHKSLNSQSERASAATAPVVGPSSRSCPENISTQPSTQTSPYKSPREASYASLARSIAVAAAAAVVGASANECGPPSAGIPMLGHNPFFNSSMMARSASRLPERATASTALSLSPSRSLLDETSVSSNILSNVSTDRSSRPGDPTLPRVNSCPPDSVNSFDAVAIASRNVERQQRTLAAVAEQQTTRRRLQISHLGIGMARPKSSVGIGPSSPTDFFALDVQHFSIPQPSPTAFQGTNSTPSSPTNVSSLTEALNIKTVSVEKTFLPTHVPLTPISPFGVGATNNSDAFTKSPILSLACAAGLIQPKRPQLPLHIEDIFSPPPGTATHSVGRPNAYSFASTRGDTGDVSDISSRMCDEHVSSSPTQMLAAETYSMPEYSEIVDDVFAMSYDPAQDVFDISSYLEI